MKIDYDYTHYQACDLIQALEKDLRKELPENLTNLIHIKMKLVAFNEAKRQKE
jgi:hypothetical protein